MRSAGCVANDLADRNLDGHVERTRLRPLVSGALSVSDALFLLFGLLSIALILVALTNPLTITALDRGASISTGLSAYEARDPPATNCVGPCLLLEHPDGFCRQREYAP